VDRPLVCHQGRFCIGHGHFTDVNVALDAVVRASRRSVPGPAATVVALPAEILTIGIRRVRNRIRLLGVGNFRITQLEIPPGVGCGGVAGLGVRIVTDRACNRVHLLRGLAGQKRRRLTIDEAALFTETDRVTAETVGIVTLADRLQRLQRFGVKGFRPVIVDVGVAQTAAGGATYWPRTLVASGGT